MNAGPLRPWRSAKSATLLLAGVAVTHMDFAVAQDFAGAQDCVAPVWGSPVSPHFAGDSDGQLFAAGLLGTGLSDWGVARLDPNGWTLLPGVFDGRPRAVARQGAEFMVAGDFLSVDGLPSAGVALFGGAQWQDLAGGLTGGSPRGLGVRFLDGQWYVGGNFDGAGDVNSPNLASWSQGAWAPVSSGVNGEVRDLAVFEGQLIAGGNFSEAGGLPIPSVAAWDGASFWPVGSAPLPPIFKLDSHNDRLGAVADGRLWLLQGANWVQPGNQPAEVDAWDLAFYDGGVFVAGPLGIPCGPLSKGPCMVRWFFSGGQWSQVGQDQQGSPVGLLTLTELDGTLYETGSTEGLMQYTTDPVLVDWEPKQVSWYEEFTLQLDLGCAIPGEPWNLQVGDLAPVELAPGTASAAITASDLGATGWSSLTLTQGEQTIHVPQAIEILPVHGFNYIGFSNPTLSGTVTAGATAGMSLYYAAEATAAPLGLAGLHSPILLDLSSTVYLGPGFESIFGGFPGNFGQFLVEPLPPGFEFFSQVLVVEVLPGSGPFVSATPVVQTNVP